MFKRILSLVLSLAMVLAGVPMAFADETAATIPADVVGTEYEEAVSRLALLEILEGYPDGTFKPENQITRAEFAAVALRTKGLESAAQAAKGLATGFTDVPASHWASGYVGTAAKAGIVNGIGNGKFAPEAPVKYEEAVTMLVRALGYEVAAQSKGGYPYGYLIVANEIGLLDAVKGTQGLPATRGAVAIMADNALEIPMMVQVGYGSDAKWVVSGTKEHGGDPKYLLDEMGFDTYQGKVTSINERRSQITLDNEDEDPVTLDVPEGFDFYEVNGLEIKVWYDNGEIILYKLMEEALFDATTVADDEIKLIGENEKYEVARGAELVLDGDDVDADEFEADYAKVVLNKYDEIVWAEGYTFDDYIVVEEVEDNEITSYNDDDLDVEDYLIVKDGKTISVEDLAQNDIVFFNDDLEFAVVYNNSKVGEISRVYTDEFRFEGKNYDIAGLYLDEDEMGDLTDEILEGMMDEEKEVEVFFDFADNVVLVIGDPGLPEANYAYAVLTKDSVVYDGRKGKMLALDVMNAAGEDHEYDLTEKFIDKNFLGLPSGQETLDELKDKPLEAGALLEITTDEDGDVTEVALLTTIELDKAFEIDDEYATAGEKDYKLQSNTAIFYDGNDEVVTLGEAEEEFSTVKEGFICVRNGRVAVVLATETDADTDVTKYTGLVTNVRRLKSGAYEFTIEVAGKEKEFITASKTLNIDEDDYEDKIVTLEVGNKSGEIDEYSLATGKTAVVKSRNTSRKTIVVTIDGSKRTIELNSDAVIYDAKLNKINIRDLEANDTITVFFEANSERFVNYILVGAKAQDGGEVATDGTITYKNATTKKIEVDGVVYTLDASTVLRNAEGTIIADGDTAVLAKLTEDVSVVYDIVAKDGVISSFKLQTAAADTLSVANITGHVAGTAVSVEIKAIDSVSEAVDTSYAKTVSVTLGGAVTLTDDVTFVKGVGTLTIPAASAPTTPGTSAAITVDGDSLTRGSFTITTVAGKAAAMTLNHPGAVQYVKETLAITGLKDAAGNNINGDYVVKVVSDKDGEVFNAKKTVTDGAVNVDVTLTTVATHTLTVTVDGFSKTTTAVISADTTKPAWTSVDAATLNGGSITINKVGPKANEIFEAESGVASVVITIAGTQYTGTVNAAGTAVTFTGLPVVTAGDNYSISITDVVGNNTNVAGIVQ